MATIDVLNKQKEFFKSGQTKDYNFRKYQLKLLQTAIKTNEKRIYDALYSDLGKIETEAYMCEVGMVLAEIKYMLKHMKRFMKSVKVNAGIATFPSKAYMAPTPKGSVLIMSPWNYPFMLTMEPLVDALAAGNTVIVKPSAYSPATSALIAEILNSTFSENYVYTVLGGREVNQDLLTLPFNHIFFTGSKAVGHEVLRQAEKNFVPVTLELGGKSPCIVCFGVDAKKVAKRIVFGKFMNVGQTCIAPDYVLVHESVKPLLMQSLICEIQAQYGENTLSDPNYGKMISKKHFDKALALLENQTPVYGGKSDEESLKIEPTIVEDPALDSPLMQEEIFAPILPVVTFKTNEEALEIISRNPTPLALYVFSNDKKVQDYFLEKVQFGGATVNDTLMHIVSPRLAFGGVGSSGLGAYHGKRGFDTFSHYKSILRKSLKCDMAVRYRPFGKFKKKIIRKFM